MSNVTDTGEQARPKRMQGVSCDACKFRKVKCDRRAKIERKRQENASQGIDDDRLEEDVACSVCTAHGLRCTFTSTTKRRRGRRIVEIQRGQQEAQPEEGGPSIRRSDNSSGNGKSPEWKGDTSEHARKPSDSRRSAIQGPSAPGRDGNRKSSHAKGRGLFQVAGLTKALLDACVVAYFRYAAPCMPILHVDTFQARYSAFFAIYEGNFQAQMPNVEQPSFGDHLEPVSEILLLAVACIGAGLLEAPIAEVGSSAKFQLQERIAVRFQEHLRHDGWGDGRSIERMDVIEAVYIMSDPQLAILDEDEPFAGWDAPADYKDKFRRSPRDPLRLSPTSHEAVVRLMFKLGINRRPKRRKDCPPGDDRVWEALDGSYVTEREVFRRVRIFWSSFCQDTFRSFGQRISPLINDDDYDQDLPRWLPRNDGDFNAYFFAEAAREKLGQTGDDLLALSSDFSPYKPSKIASGDPSPAAAAWGVQVPRFSRFDAYQLETMLRLAFIVRAVSIRFVSPRSQGRGVLTSDVERAVFSFKAWRSQLPSEVTWEVQSAPLFMAKRAGKPSSSNMVAMRNSLKTLFLESLFLGQVLGTWAAVDDFGLRIDVDVTEAAHMFAIKLGVSTSGASAIPGAPRRSQLAPEDVRKKVRAQLDELVAASFFRIAKLHKEAADLGILRANRSVLMNVASAYCVWGCGLAKHLLLASSSGLQTSMPSPSTTSSGPTEISGPSITAEEVLRRAEDLITAVASCDSCEDAPKVVTQLRLILHKTRSEAEITSSDAIFYHRPGLTDRVNKAMFDASRRESSSSQSPSASTKSSEPEGSAPVQPTFPNSDDCRDLIKSSSSSPTRFESIFSRREDSRRPLAEPNLSSSSNPVSDNGEQIHSARAPIEPPPGNIPIMFHFSGTSEKLQGGPKIQVDEVQLLSGKAERAARAAQSDSSVSSSNLGSLAVQQQEGLSNTTTPSSSMSSGGRTNDQQSPPSFDFDLPVFDPQWLAQFMSQEPRMDVISDAQLDAQLDVRPNATQVPPDGHHSTSNIPATDSFAAANSSVSPSSSNGQSQHQQDYNPYQRYQDPNAQMQQQQQPQLHQGQQPLQQDFTSQFSYPAQTQSFPYQQQAEPSVFAASPANPAGGAFQGNDRQWANIMAASDAQLWAGAAWEGFDFDMTNAT